MNRIKRAWLLLAAAALVPACHGDGGGGGGTPALFSDDFNRTDVGSGWSSTTSSGGSAVIDAAQGSPAPGLSLSANQTSGSAGAESTMTFTAPFTATLDVDSLNTANGSGGVAFDDASGAQVAAASWSSIAGGAITFTIAGNSAVRTATDGFQRIALRVDSLGTATWSLNGSDALTQAGFPTGPVTMRLFTQANSAPPPGAAVPNFVFDNVVVTAP